MAGTGEPNACSGILQRANGVDSAYRTHRVHHGRPEERSHDMPICKWVNPEAGLKLAASEDEHTR